MRGKAAATLLLLALAGCHEPTCEDEDITVNVGGTCGAPTRALLTAARCGISVEPLEGKKILPPYGAQDQARDPLRQGHWQIWGPVCPASDPSCATPTEFRRCFATRVQWRLELDCMDGTGAPVCKAELTE